MLTTITYAPDLHKLDVNDSFTVKIPVTIKRGFNLIMVAPGGIATVKNFPLKMAATLASHEAREAGYTTKVIACVA